MIRQAAMDILGGLGQAAMSPLGARRLVLRAFGRGGIGAEIGVFRGDFSAEILRVARPRELHLIDPWRNVADPDLTGAWYSTGSDHDMDEVFATVQARFQREVAEGTVALHRHTSSEALACFDDGSLDFVYIDGDHRYRAVREDLERAFQKLKPGGILAGDDYSLGGWWEDGVVRAVHEVLGHYAQDLRIDFIVRGQFVLRKL